MSLTIRALVKACKLLSVPYRFIDQNKAVLAIDIKGNTRIVLSTRLGLLTEAEWWILRDKYYTNLLFAHSGLFPQTMSFADPDATKHFAHFAKEKSIGEIVDRIESAFSFPVVVKRNRGTQGYNVFICQTRVEIASALEQIYSKQQIEYDHIALAQEYIEPANEYRLIVFNSQLEFAYQKPHHLEKFGGKKEADLIVDASLLARFETLVQKLTDCYPLSYGGIDVVEDSTGKLFVLEINGSPSYSQFIKKNGDKWVVDMFTKILNYWLGKQ